MEQSLSLGKGQYSGKVGKLQFLSGITLGSTTYPESWRQIPMHFHQNPHISLLLSGHHLEKRKGKEFCRKPGDVLFCRAGESHQFISGTSAQNVNIELDQDFLKQYEISENQIERALNQVDVKLKILKMFHELTIQGKEMESSIQMLLLDLLHREKKEISSSPPPWLDTLLILMHESWMEALTLEELSLQLGVHPVSISKYFTKFLGCTFGEYRRKLKVSKSLEFIKNSQFKLTEIAYQAGFADQSHFSRSFKSLVGFTPKAYQKWEA